MTATAARNTRTKASTMTEPAPHRSTVSRRWRLVALAVVILRFAVPLAAIPMIPFLIRRNVTLLVLLRPQKEFLLVGGGQSRYLGEPGLLPLFLAYLPLGILAVSAFFVVGRAYRRALATDTGPAWLQRVVPPHQLRLAQRVLARRGPFIAVVGRLAALPPTVLAAAAGTSEVSPRRYLAADLVGAILGFGLAAGSGLALGQAYEEGGVWLTVLGIALFTAMIGLVTWWMHREAALDHGDEDGDVLPGGTSA